MTLNAMFRYPDLYKTGIAVAFVSDQRLYDTIYQERYMGLPKDNEEGFKNGRPSLSHPSSRGICLSFTGRATTTSTSKALRSSSTSSSPTGSAS